MFIRGEIDRIPVAGIQGALLTPYVLAANCSLDGWEEIAQGSIDTVAKGSAKILGAGCVLGIVEKALYALVRAAGEPSFGETTLGRHTTGAIAHVVVGGLVLAVAKAAYNALTSQAIESK